MSHMRYPMLLEPRFDPKIWGGRRLNTVLGKSLPIGVNIGESLESDDLSWIMNGPFRGATIGDLIEREPQPLLGHRGMAANQALGGFPLLAKFIDATDVLSVQVHPDDEMASALQKRGKTEAWHIIDAAPDSTLITGVRAGVTVDQIAQAITDIRLGELLIETPVAPGDTFLVPARTTHAIGAGVLLYEIQQASDVTFRMYDWGRLDDAGKPRDLHVRESLKAVKTDCHARQIKALDIAPGRTVLTACRYFALERWEVAGEIVAPSFGGETFLLASCVRGVFEIESDDSRVVVGTGQTVLVPAAACSLRLHGDASVLVSYIPDLETDIRLPLLDRGFSSEEIASLSGDLDDLREHHASAQA